MSGSLVQTAVSDGVGTLSLTRPAAGNAMNAAFMQEFADGVDRLTSDPAVRAILVRAEGKNFCVGGDINEFADQMETGEAGPFITRLAHVMHRGIETLATHPVPVVVAVQGAAAGAGLGLAMAGDIVLAGESSFFALAYGTIGLTPDGGASWMLPRLIGMRLTQDLAYTGRRLTAQEALQHGLITRITSDDALGEEALAMAQKLASSATAAFGGMKRLLCASATASFNDQLNAEAQAIGQAITGAEAREGITAFLAKRAPDFRTAE